MLDNILRDYNARFNELGNLEVVKTTDVIFENIYNILKTPKGSYPWEPSFGSNLFSYLYEQLDDILLESAQSELTSDILRWENRAEGLSIELTKNTVKKLLFINIDFSYKGMAFNRTINGDLFKISKRLHSKTDEELFKETSKFDIEKVVGINIEAYNLV